MVSEAMAVQAESVGIRSNSIFTSESAISLSPQLKDQFSCGNNDFSPKVRKPYTITKQRERWTEEEHRKFLEALKLYGRAWRKIEEHVGSKTAVQIRSHAQKFFFKVSRDPSGGSNTNCNTNPEDPIEIPPPRPKRKPVHPYPRKIVQSPSKETVMSDHSNRSLSPNFSFSEDENHSPKSVLSVMGSEMVGSNGSETPAGCLSPVSYAFGIRDEILGLAETNPSAEDSGSRSCLVSVPTAKFPVKLELFTKESAHAKESSTEETSSRTLKLFGRTVLVTESQRPSMSPETSNEHREESLPRHSPQAVKALYLMHFHNESSNFSGPTSPTPMPSLWPFYSGLNFPVMQFNKPEPVKGSFESKLPEDESSANVDTSLELDSLQRRTSLDRKEKERESVFKLKPSPRSAFSQLRIRTDKTRRGFVPYKKNIAEEETRLSTISGDESEEKSTDLCL